MKIFSIVNYVLLSFVILTILFIDNFNLQDLPDHIARASIIKDLIFQNGFISNNFKIDLFFVPYLLPDLFNSFLLSFLDFRIVSKVYVIYALLIYYIGTSKYISNKYLKIIPLILMFNLILFKGNINFILGIGILFWCLSEFKNISIWKYSFLSLLIYSSHLLCLFVWLFVTGIELIKNKKWYYLIIPIILCLIYFLHQSGGIESEKYVFGNLLKNFDNKFTEIKTLFSVLGKNWWIPLLILPIYFKSNRGIWISFSLLIMSIFLPNNIGSLVRPFERLFIISLIVAIPNIILSDKYLKIVYVGIFIIFWSGFGIFSEMMIKNCDNLKNSRIVYNLIPENSKVKVIKNNFYYPLLMHYDKYLICKKCVVNDLFELKHTLVRYKDRNYHPDYIIFYGAGYIKDEKVKLMKDFNYLKLYEVEKVK